MSDPSLPAARPIRRRLLLAAAAWPIAAPCRSGAPALPLARPAPDEVDPQGWLVSEKYDGARGVWDGATLRFRSGEAVNAARWFTERLPPEPLDGELWLGRGRFEALAAAVKRRQPDPAEWRAIRYLVFELPHGEGDFAARASRIAAIMRRVGWPQLMAVDQERIDGPTALRRRLDQVVRAGGEGLVLHRADAPWAAGRQAGMVKLKPVADADAIVIGHLPGRGRLDGRLGALRVRSDDGHEFLIGSGLSDAARADPPPIGSVVTYTYRGHTEAGLPRFATFLRLRPV